MPRSQLLEKDAPQKNPRSQRQQSRTFWPEPQTHTTEPQSHECAPKNCGRRTCSPPNGTKNAVNVVYSCLQTAPCTTTTLPPPPTFRTSMRQSRQRLVATHTSLHVPPITCQRPALRLPSALATQMRERHARPQRHDCPHAAYPSRPNYDAHL